VANSATNPPPLLSEDKWKQVAENQLDQTYTVSKGDTLWDISKKLFGDAFYWPNIWKINGEQIPNPDLIFPNQILKFSLGTATSLPSLSVNNSLSSSANDAATTDAPTRYETKSLRSQQWKDLPLQSWENIEVSLPKTADKDGFDLRTRYLLPSSEKIDSIGIIDSGISFNALLTVNDTILIKESDSESLAVGKVFLISSEPTIIRKSLFSNKAYAYPILGKVRIIESKENVWIGQIISASGAIERRKSFLIRLLFRHLMPSRRTFF
jgi:LysM domain